MDMHDAKPQNYVGAFQIWQYKNSNKDNWLHTWPVEIKGANWMSVLAYYLFCR